MKVKRANLAVAFPACLVLAAVLVATLSSCTAPPRLPTIHMPLLTDRDELHWRMFFEDQFDCFGQAPPPPPNAPSVAWTAFYAARDSYRIRQAADAARSERDAEAARAMREQQRAQQQAWQGLSNSTHNAVQSMENTRRNLFNH